MDRSPARRSPDDARDPQVDAVTARPPSATSWRLVDIRPTAEADGSPAIAVRFGADGQTHVLSPDEPEDAGWRLLEAAKLARAGIGRDDPETAD